MRSKIFLRLKKEFAKPTPVFLIGLLGLIFLSIVVIALLPDQTAGLGVAYAIILIMVIVIAVLLDRVVVRRFKLYPIVYIEVILIIIVCLSILWSSRSTELIVNTRQDHFVIVYMNGGKTIEDFKYAFPFSKVLTIRDEVCIVLDKSLLERNDIQIKPEIQVATDAWRGYSIKSEQKYIKGNLSNVVIYWTGNTGADTNEFLTCIENL